MSENEKSIEIKRASDRKERKEKKKQIFRENGKINEKMENNKNFCYI